jgi:hypothetical protein
MDLGQQGDTRMMGKERIVRLVFVAACAAPSAFPQNHEFNGGYPVEATSKTARDDADFQRAVTAYRFWFPTVSCEGIFNGNRATGLKDDEHFAIMAGGPRQVDRFESEARDVRDRWFAQASGGEAAQSDEGNTGQDPTRPLMRTDLRWKHLDFEGDHESDLFTLRADVPFVLGREWQLATRADVPFVLTNLPSADNPDGDHEFGLSDVLVQALFITPSLDEGKRWKGALGTQVILPTADQDHFGAGKYQLSPSVAAVCQLPEIRPGSFAGLLVREQFSFAGDDDRRDINDLVVQPILTVTLTSGFFVSTAPEIRIDLEHHEGAFIPLDLLFGMKASRDVVLSIQLDAPLHDHYEQYDAQIEFRIGVFF